jgi:hypothetical protein
MYDDIEPEHIEIVIEHSIIRISGLGYPPFSGRN